MTHATHIAKGRDGWEAKTDIELGNSRIVRLSTSKGGKGIHTRAQVWKLGNDGSMSFEMFGDYSKVIQQEAKRCTEKSITDLHAEVLRTSVHAVLKGIEAHYAAKPNSPFANLQSMSEFQGVAACATNM